jgi:2-polyprenyl-3-methyl-5-hydroxy-6-metoxy-1,4-benzoquinol methylase
MSDISNMKLCPVCLEGFPQMTFRYLGDYNIKDASLQLFQCSICEVKFWYPFKNPGPEWYKECEQNQMHRSFEDKEYFIWLSENRSITKHFFNDVPHKLANGLKLLDVGCGTGGFLLQAKKIGYDVTGVDFDPEQIKVAQSFGLADTFQGDVVEFLNKHPGEFDVITGFEIIEHLDNPREFLEAIYKALKPGGVLCLSTPNNRRIGPKNEFWDFPYHHLSRWTKRSLENVITLENFKHIKVKEELPLSFLVSKTRFGFGAFLRKKKAKDGAVTQTPAKQYKDSVARLGSIKDKAMAAVLWPVALGLFMFGKKGQGLYLTAKK